MHRLPGRIRPSRSRAGHIYYLLRSTNPATPNVYKPGITSNLARRHRQHGADRWALVSQVNLGSYNAWSFEQQILAHFADCRIADTSEMLVLTTEEAEQLIATMRQTEAAVMEWRADQRRRKDTAENAVRPEWLGRYEQAFVWAWGITFALVTACGLSNLPASSSAVDAFRCVIAAAIAAFVVAMFAATFYSDPSQRKE